MLLVLLSIFVSVSAKSQLTADFKANTTAGCAPVVIKFNDLSKGNPTAWLWDLGNGITSSQKNPVTFYFDPGTYTISLRIINGNDTQRIVKEHYITVYSLPEIKFKLSDSIGCFPLAIRFTDLSIPKSGEIRNLQWDFGDGTFSNESIADHTYNVAGNFSISLIATTTFGCKAFLSKRSLVKVLSGVKAGFEVESDSSCNAPANFKFKNTSVGKEINSYKWNFGDGKSDTATNPNHTYTSQGFYSVGLTVSNTDGCSDTIYKKNLVTVGSVDASFTSPDTVCENTSVIFTNTSEPLPTSVLWKFGDGSTSTLLNPTKSFLTAGTYTVTLTSFFSGCSDVATHTITVLPLPSAGFTTSNLLSTCKDPLTVDFKSNDQTLAAYQWNFGNGKTSTASSTSSVYTTSGLYSVSLQVTGTNGCINKLMRNNLVYFGPPSVLRIDGLPYRGCAPFTTKLSAPVDSPEPIKSYLWSFGDSSISTQVAPTHFWANAGNYNISVTVTTVNGCSTTFSLLNGLVLTKKPVIAFNATPHNACAFQNINFKDSTIGNVTKLEWFFGDGGTSIEKNPIYNYKDTGSFDIMLVASNEGCIDTLKARDFIYINPPIARFEIVLDCATPSFRQFIDSSLGATSWAWNFGDNTTSTEQNPQHTFSKSGLFNVKLQVSNGICTHTITQPVNVVDEKAVLSVSNASKCKSSVTRLIANDITAGFYNQFLWDFGDGNSSVTQVGLNSYSYPLPGTFKPSVTLVDINGCRQILTHGMALNVLGPIADFSMQPQACIQSAINISNLSTPTAGNPISNFIWNYGDGNIDTLTGGAVIHTYDTSGTFTIQLKVTDSFGCTDEITKTAIILVTQPKASFSVSDSIRCRLSNVNFISTSTGVGLKYLWNLGDGVTSILEQFAYNYKSENLFNIKLVVTDIFGCQDSLMKQNAIQVVDVKAKLQTNDSVSSCPPFNVTLLNQSANYASFSWDFDDGSFSNLDTPSHYYNVPDIYHVKLIAKGYGSCTDTATTTITLYGPSGKFRYDPFTVCSPGVATFVGSTLSRASFIWDFGDGTIEQTSDSVTTHEYINPGKYKPKLLLVDVGGCQVPIIGKDTILIIKANAVIKNFTSLYCDSTTVQFFDSSYVDFDKVSGYTWNFGDGSKDTINQNPIHVYRSPGNYPVTLTIKTSNGCTNTSNLQTVIKVVKTPSIKIVSDASVCQDNTTLFKGEELVKDTSILQWKWDFGNGQTTTLQNPPLHVFNTSGSYIIKAFATNSSGCNVASRQPFTVYPTPKTNAGNDTVLCIGNTLLLQPSGADTYRWSNQPTLSCVNCTNPVAKPVIATTYQVEGTSTFGCKSSDTVRVIIAYPFKATTSLTDTLCIGESARLFASGSDIYNWAPAAGLNNASVYAPVARPDATTNYQVIVSDKYKCFADTGYVKIVVYPIPKIKIEQNEYTLLVGNSVLLKTTRSEDVTSIKWTPYIGLSCIDCAQPMASPQNSTDYYVKVFNDGGCKAEDKVTITVICSNTNIFIPNTFSPNGDGMNDVFFVRGKGIAAIKAITIFNRWGIVVFQKTNININDPVAGWDGRYNSAVLSPDVFVYKVDVVCENNQVFSLKGNVTLIR